MRRFLALTSLSLCLGAQALAEGFEVGEDVYKRYRELANEGYQIVPMSGSGTTLFGMQEGETLYMCFLADNEDFHQTRQATIIDHIENGTAPKPVPNIPVVCVKAE